MITTIDILCRVVDNFGDIGVAYRLAKALSDLDPGLGLRLVVEGLEAFRALAPEIDPGRDVQELRGWTVLRWDAAPEAVEAAYRGERPRFVVECFACGKPDWFEALVFDDALPGETVILNLEYLTAEPYARDFHLLQAATRSSRVRKFFFMPGFEEGTGGLVIDGRFRASRERFLGARGGSGSDRAGPATAGATPASCGTSLARLRSEAAAAAGIGLEAGWAERFWVCVFGYERDYSRIVVDLAAFSERLGDGSTRGGGILVLAAAGKSQACFMGAWEEAGRPFPALALPFLSQESWDELLLGSDFLIVRGEESLARAALSGRPFLWQSYPQAEKHQLVKVEAFLERLRPCFGPIDFEVLEKAYRAFNDRLADAPDLGGREEFLPLLERLPELERGFERFSAEVAAMGDLAQRLLTFFYRFV